MKARWLVTLGVGSLLLAHPVAAQRPGTLEVGTFGRFATLDDANPFDNVVGLSGRMGLFVLPRISVEGDISLGRSEASDGTTYNVMPMHARLNYNHPVGSRSDLVLGLGYSRISFGDYDGPPNPQDGYGALVGLRIGMGERLAFRVDGTMDNMPASWNSQRGRLQPGAPRSESFKSQRHFGLQAGVSLMLRPGQQSAVVVAAQPEPPVETRAAEPTPEPPPSPARDDAADAARVRDILAEMVHFDFDRSNVRTDAQPVLERKAEVLRANPGVRLRIEGHADERGSAEYNLALGMRRANAVKEYLVGLGLDASRFEVVSLGEDRPLDPASNEAAWARNRRAEFHILSGADQLRLP